MSLTLDRLFEEFLKLGDPDEQAKVLAFAAMEAAESVASEAPAAAQQALSQAKRFWSGDLSAEDLKEARVAAWRSLDGRSCDFADRPVNHVRLVLCSLYSEVKEGQEDMAWQAVIDFSQAVGVSEAVLEESLRRLLVSIAEE